MNRVRLAAVAVMALALGAAACSTYRGPAPVEERARASKAASKPAAAAAQAAKPAAAPATDGFYTVKQGDTLYSIALDNGADYREVAQWNALDDPTKLRIGQVLRVKPEPRAPDARPGVVVGSARGAGRVESRSIDSAPPASAEGAAKTEPKALRLPYSKENAAMAAREEPKAEGEGVDFIWPVKGKVLAGFAEPRSKGIDIDGKLGDPVLAAAAGRVTYIGTGIPGMGKLVVIKHDNGFITVYAHNRDILVKEQQSVTRGQKIAELGNTDADRPKLHFQIRKGSAAVDPMRYLPAS
ncbi:MAG TPA: peptidoglycan DD-metalloendopeptidase family protein [Burkholderiales bacterium]|nr:peptidoglycan DD-metalloendopeptidase family protein [Burkholderiales bacterium]